MDPDRARELLEAERRRIERAIVHRKHMDDAEEADEYDPANLAADLSQSEFDEGLEADLREQLAASSAPSNGSWTERTVFLF